MKTIEETANQHGGLPAPGITDLHDLVMNQSLTSVDIYLGDVSTEQFVKDVKALIARCSDKVVIKEAIDRLNTLLDGDTNHADID